MYIYCRLGNFVPKNCMLIFFVDRATHQNFTGISTVEWECELVCVNLWLPRLSTKACTDLEEPYTQQYVHVHVYKTMYMSINCACATLSQLGGANPGGIRVNEPAQACPPWMGHHPPPPHPHHHPHPHPHPHHMMMEHPGGVYIV